MKENILNILWANLAGFIVLFIFSTSLYAQQQLVSGKVTDTSSGETLPGVNIVVRGTTTGTSTDADGEYELTVESLQDTLVFSFIGYQTREISINGRTEVNVSLQPQTIAGEELVVIGYGTQQKRDLTGSVSSIDLEATSESPNTNVMQALQGSLPGVQIGQVNQAGEEPSISIRGQTTLNGDRDPLIVVDGIIYRGRIGDLNPANIESIDVLKDASSKAIYGSQAANGVILISTKRGNRAEGKPIIRFSSSYSTQSPTKDIDLLGPEEYLQKVKDIEYRDAYNGPDYAEPNPNWDFSQSELLPPVLEGIENGTRFDWLDATTSPGYLTDHMISVSGGNENTTYYISGGYNDQEGYIQNDTYTRTNLRINVETNVTDWLTIGANTFGTFADFSGSYPDVNDIATTSPFIEPRDENGEFVINHFGDNIINPLLESTADDEDKNTRLSGIFYGRLEIPKITGLAYDVNFSYNRRSFQHYHSSEFGAGRTGSAFKANVLNNDLTLDNIITYDRDFGAHGIKATLVAGFNEVDNERTQATGENFTNLSLSYNSLEQATIQRINSSAWNESYIYQMGRVNYSYDDRYLLTATLRRDGFSGFAENNKIALFPSVAVGWVVSEESFFESNTIGFLKLRASYGQNGNKTSRYSSLARVSAGGNSNYVFGDGASTATGQTVSSLANDNLSWELTTELNVGVDFELFENRLGGSIDYYNSTTEDLLWDQVLPEITGFSQIRTNLGQLSNTGLEIALNTTPVQSQKFNWNLNANFATNKNRIDKLLGLDSDGDGQEDDLVASGLFIGKSIGTIYNYEIDGIWQLDDDIMSGYFPGTYKLVDQNGDGEITPEDDRVFLGRTEPAYRIGIQNTLSYENFTLRFFINMVQGGNDGYLAANHPFGVSGTTGTAQNHNWYNMWEHWSPTNPDAKYPQTWLNPAQSTVRFEQRNFVRLQDATLSYNLGSSLTEKIGMRSAKIYVSGKNLLTLTNWDGLDPETGQGVGNNNVFPVMRIYSVGFDISF